MICPVPSVWLVVTSAGVTACHVVSDWGFKHRKTAGRKLAYPNFPVETFKDFSTASDNTGKIVSIEWEKGPACIKLDLTPLAACLQITTMKGSHF
jgi:hypothetical protein